MTSPSHSETPPASPSTPAVSSEAATLTERYWEARTAQPATAMRTVTGDEWNAVTRLHSLIEGEKLNADQLRFALKCVEDLGEAEWRVRRDRDRLRAGVPREASSPLPTEDERALRRMVWLRHACTGNGGIGKLYGDDGEMQCSECLIDFKRESVAEIERRLMLLGLAKLAERGSVSPSQTPSPEPEPNDAVDAARWRAIKRFLGVSHMFDPGRLGFAPTYAENLALNIKLRFPDTGRSPRLTVDQFVEWLQRDPKAANALEDRVVRPAASTPESKRHG